MRRVLFVALVSAIVVAGALATRGGATHDGPGFKTAKPYYLVPTAPGVQVDKILSTGDIVGDYQMSGIPDGLGAYANRGHHKGTFTVVMNHELGKTFPGQPPLVDTRISRLEIDRATRSVHEGEYLFRGDEGFERFCSATLAMVFGRPFYFTGEEANDFGGVSAGHDGSSIVLDPESGMWRETPHFGKLQHENIVPVRLSKWVFLTSEDDFRPGPSHLYAYIARDFNRALRGVDGSLHVWKADNPATNQNSAAVKGVPIPGHFVPITQAENATSATLKAASAPTARNAFRFDRLEDIALRPDVRGRTYIADTGKPPSTARGRVYQFDINPHNPTRATLTMILNGDAPNNDDIYNPDNLDASEKVLMIQEDREAAFRAEPQTGGWGRVMEYRFSNGSLRSVARVNTPPGTPPTYPNPTPCAPPCPPGTWESSGIIDVGHLLGKDWWLLDVQAHRSTAPQPGPTLTPNSSAGEDGQLLALYVPGSQGGGGHDDDDDDDDESDD